MANEDIKTKYMKLFQIRLFRTSSCCDG